ncbi:ABC transporter ATP-binding protein [Thermicanus aegyptius]|uniref:ABC transporter ATP-binding protein n=1 Tax=Thermicanus aegyptius TaxID=94009 RepID=UPI00041B7CED|nr:ABC transporter ATP-binding protein [Thermicanus aegyptius]
MIEITNLSKKYGRDEWALVEMNLKIEKGIFGLLGPNGAGKTTLMRILATLLKPTNGTALLNGRSLDHPEEVRKIIGYLPQHFQIYPKITAMEFLDYVAVMKGIGDPRRRKAEIMARLEEVNLSSVAHKKVGTYSGGMKQRLGVAQALLGNPEILIVDEPTTGLDPEERVRLRNLFARFGLDRILILSTHIVSDIENLCHTVGVLDGGRLRYSGDLPRLRHFAEGKVREVESAARSISPSVEEGYLALIGGADYE